MIDIIREYESLTHDAVKIYAKNKLQNIKAFSIVLRQKFQKQGIKNNISELVDVAIEDVKGLEMYIEMLQEESKAWRAKHDSYAEYQLRLQDRILELEEELIKEKNSNSL